MHYIIGAVVGGWILFSLIASGAGLSAWVAALAVVSFFVVCLMLDSRCPKCKKINALVHADDGPGVDGAGDDVKQVHFECHHCGHRLSRRTPLGRRRSSNNPA